MFALRRVLLSAAVVGVVSAWSATSFATGLFIFADTASPGLDVDLGINVTGGHAYFEFTNNSSGGSSAARVHEIYFETGLSSLLTTTYTADATGTPLGSTTVGVSLTPPPAPPAPPGSNALVPGWSGVFKGFDEHNSAVGIGVGQSWIVDFTLQNASTTAAAILAAITGPNSTSRIALHIGECVTGGSCGAIITSGPGGPDLATPLPAAIWLFGTVLAGGLGVKRWRKRKGTGAALVPA